MVFYGPKRNDQYLAACWEQTGAVQPMGASGMWCASNRGWHYAYSSLNADRAGAGCERPNPRTRKHRAGRMELKRYMAKALPLMNCGQQPPYRAAASLASNGGAGSLLNIERLTWGWTIANIPTWCARSRSGCAQTARNYTEFERLVIAVIRP
jgi:hypothetical protein